MKRLITLSLGVLLLAAPAFAQAKADKAGASKTLTAAGKVSAVDASSVTVKGKAGEWKFDVDKGTTVVAKGASHRVASLNADKKPTVITEFVAVGNDVRVKYHDMGASKHAASVTVLGAPPLPPAKKK